MAARGPKPKPAALRIAQGNPSNNPIPDQPKVPRPVRLPKPPDYLGDVGKAKWREIGKLWLEMGVLTIGDFDALSNYCTLWEMYIQACEDFKICGIDSDCERTINKVSPMLLRLQEQFGMTPASRNRVGTPGKKVDKKDPYWGTPAKKSG